MRRLLALTPLIWLASVAVCIGQEPAQNQATNQTPALTSPQTTAVIPMLPADQRYDTPKQAVIRRARLKAEQRRLRMADRAAMGYSPLRPPSSPVPMMGMQPRWIGHGIYYSFPGAFYQNHMPTIPMGLAPEVLRF